MTDHKAEWVRDAQEWGRALNEAAWTFIGACPEKSALLFNNSKAPLRLAILKYAEEVGLTAAPAASEGEDGAVAWQYRYRNQGPNAHVYNTFVHPLKGRQDGGAEIEWWVYGVKPSRPAAQVAATPKHDEGREAWTCECGQRNTSWATECGRCERLPPGDALATQPAARRVTDEDVERIIDRTERENSIEGIDGDSWDRLLVRTALESFAQPAEGVSGG